MPTPKRKPNAEPRERWAILRWLVTAGKFLLWLFRLARNTALIAFFGRYWWLFVIFAAAVLIIFSNVLFDALGLLIYLPAFTTGAAITALLIRNVINRDTTDADADSGYTTRAWRKLPSRDRVIWSKIEILVYFLGACLIAAALAFSPSPPPRH